MKVFAAPACCGWSDTKRTNEMKRLAFFMVILLLVPAFGADIYVNHTGSSTPPYDTETKAATDIQVALDAVAAGDTVLIKADQDYVMDGVDQQAAQFDVDANEDITIKGYYLSPGDQDYGGAYYKDANHGWAVLDANNGAFHIFSAGDVEHIRWCNIKTKNVNSSYYSFDLTPTLLYRHGYMVQNCWTTGGKRAIYGSKLYSPMARDCKFTGTYGTTPGNTVVGFIGIYNGAFIESCEFAHGDASVSVKVSAIDSHEVAIVYNNIFNISGDVGTVISIVSTGFIANNVIYENDGGDITYGISLPSVFENSMVFNNIIVGCGTSINDPVGVNFGGWNCFYNNETNWTLHEGDIVADPQFVDAVNGDFRLNPTSPCLSRGKPTMLSGYTDIGAWQGKSIGFRGEPPANCVSPLEMDLNDDCKVDFRDLAIFAESWLECNLNPPDGC